MSVKTYFKKKAKTSMVISTFSISFLLILMGIIGLVILETRNLIDLVKENAEVQVFVSDESSTLDILALSKQINASGYIKNMRFVSKEEAKRILTADLGEDFVDFIGYNPLKASIVLQLKSQYANSDSIVVITNFIKQNQSVTEVRYHRLLLDTINKNIENFAMFGLGICSLFLILSLFLINNAVKLALFSERFLIKSMQLVGATKGFIRKPFLLRGLWQGIVAGILASGSLLGLLFWVNQNIANLTTILKLNDLLLLFAFITSISVIITTLSSLLAANKYLNADIDELY